MVFNYTDRSADFAYLAPGNEAYTLCIAGQPDLVLPSVLTEPVSYREELPADGMVQQGDLLAVWPIANSQQPPLGSRLIDPAGAVWTILTVVRRTRSTRGSVRRGTWPWPTRWTTLPRCSHRYTKSPAGRRLRPGPRSGRPLPPGSSRRASTAQIFEDAEWTKTQFTVVLSQDVLDWTGYPVELTGARNYRLMDQQGRHHR